MEAIYQVSIHMEPESFQEEIKKQNKQKQNIPGGSFVPVYLKKIKQADQLVAGALMLEKSDCASLKIDMIKVTDTDNFF